MLYIVLIVVAFVSWYFPKKIRFLLFLIALLIPDPLPYLDEVIILIGLLKK